MSVKKERIRVGIDPGTKTGVAAYSLLHRKLISCQTFGIVKAMGVVEKMFYDEDMAVEVWFEDARLRKWFGNSGREKLQGAGSVKRDCVIWEEFCKHHGIPFRMIPPRDVTTKLTKNMFTGITGWTGRTSEHARDAAMIVVGS